MKKHGGEFSQTDVSESEWQDIEIPQDEIIYTASRGGGPGGQNVNKVNTRVTATWDFMHSRLALTDEQRMILAEKLRGRLNKNGQLAITNSDERSQHQNKIAAAALLHKLVNNALTPQKERVATNVSGAVHDRRVAEKRLEGKRKAERGRNWDREE